MKTSQLTLCFLLCIFGATVKANPASSLSDSEKGYYWREYTRDVPRDAFPGGRDNRGKPTYIGQTVTTGCGAAMIITGQIFEAEKKMTYEWGYEEQTAKEHVQILCTRNPERFEWIKTNATEIQKIKDKHLVSGGMQKNYTVYIGRAFADGQIGVGRIIVTNVTNTQGLFTTIGGKYLHVFSSFDVLAYKDEPKPTASKLKSPNSSTTSTVWQPIFVLVILRTIYFSLKL